MNSQDGPARSRVSRFLAKLSDAAERSRLAEMLRPGPMGSIAGPRRVDSASANENGRIPVPPGIRPQARVGTDRGANPEQRLESPRSTEVTRA